MRTAFIIQLCEEARKNQNIFLIVGDLGYSVVEPFKDEFPSRFLNAGVAEQNMAGVAAGLAMEGYKVFIYSIANFPTLRCMEQIRYDICYHNLDVKIVAVGGGFAYGSLGASHHATEDIGMLRTIPNITICAPGDPVETKKITTMLSNNKGPCYLRLGKAGEPIVHNQNIILYWGKIVKVIDGNNTAILSTGAMLKYSFDYVKNENKGWSLYSVPFIKPLDYDGLLEICNKHKTLITIEEHQKSSGFGSSILEGINDLLESGELQNSPRLIRIGIPDKFYTMGGSQNYLRNKAEILFRK
jgi:transketolase